MLGRTLKMAFWVTYDHLGKLILANIVWFMVFAVPGSLGLTALGSGDRGLQIFIGLPLVVLAVGVLLPVVTAGLAHMVKVLIDTRDGAIGDLFRGIRLYGWRAAGIGLASLALVAALSTSAWFYAIRLGASVPWLGYAISAGALWCLLFLLLADLMVMPALVQKKAGVWTSLKLAGLLVLANPFFIIGLAIQFTIFTAVSLAICAVVPILYGSVAVVLVSSAYEMLARKYAGVDAAEALAPGAPARRWPPKDEEDDYLNRGLRDAIFPWKG